MEILELIDRLESLAAQARKVPITGRAMIDAERLLELVDQMRLSVPRNVQDANEIIERREQIINQTMNDARRLRATAEQDARALVDESELTKLAKRRSEEIMAEAEQRAERIATQTGRSRLRASDLHSDEGAGWGFSADAKNEKRDAEEAALEELSFEALYAQAKANGLNMTVRQTRLVEQRERRAEKLANLQAETERIQAKEFEGLSEGQSAQLRRNEERATELRQQVESLEEQIADSIREQLGTKRVLDSKPKGGKGGKRPASDDDDGGDDFYDRTSSKRKGSLAARRRAFPRRPPPHPPFAAARARSAARVRPDLAPDALARQEQAKPMAAEVETEATLRAKLKENAAEQVAR